MGAFKLGKMTFGSLFKKPETVRYPFEKKEQPTGLKGHIRIDVDTCILCGLCERSCTTDCITVEKAQRYWEINAFGCIQCGYCTTVCPKKCLHMDPDYHPADTQISSNRFEVPVQEKPAQTAKTTEKPTPAAQPEKARPVPAQGEATQSAAREQSAVDSQLEALIGLMDENAAGKVREALTRDR